MDLLKEGKISERYTWTKSVASTWHCVTVERRLRRVQQDRFLQVASQVRSHLSRLGWCTPSSCRSHITGTYGTYSQQSETHHKSHSVLVPQTVIKISLTFSNSILVSQLYTLFLVG